MNLTDQQAKNFGIGLGMTSDEVLSNPVHTLSKTNCEVTAAIGLSSLSEFDMRLGVIKVFVKFPDELAKILNAQVVQRWFRWVHGSQWHIKKPVYFGNRYQYRLEETTEDADSGDTFPAWYMEWDL